ICAYPHEPPHIRSYRSCILCKDPDCLLQNNSCLRPLSRMDSHLGANILIQFLNVPLSPLLVFYLFHPACTVFVFRCVADRIQFCYGKLIAGTDPPLIGHISGTGSDSVCRKTSGNTIPSLGQDFYKFAFLQPKASAVFCIHLYPARLVFQIPQGTAVSCHSPYRIMPYLTHRRQCHWILLIFLFQRRVPLCSIKQCLLVCCGKFAVLMQVRSSLILHGFIPAGPLDTSVFFHFLIGCPLEAWAQINQLVPDLLCIFIFHRISH